MASLADHQSVGPDDGEAPPGPEGAFPDLPDIQPVAPEIGQKGLDPVADGETW